MCVCGPVQSVLSMVVRQIAAPSSAERQRILTRRIDSIKLPTAYGTDKPSIDLFFPSQKKVKCT